MKKIEFDYIWIGFWPFCVFLFGKWAGFITWPWYVAPLFFLLMYKRKK